MDLDVRSHAAYLWLVVQIMNVYSRRRMMSYHWDMLVSVSAGVSGIYVFLMDKIQ